MEPPGLDINSLPPVTPFAEASEVEVTPQDEDHDFDAILSGGESQRVLSYVESNLGHSLPTVEEARFDAIVSGNNPYSGKRKRTLALAVISVLALIAIIGFSLGIAKKNERSSSSSATTGSNDWVTSTPPEENGVPHPSPSSPSPPSRPIVPGPLAPPPQNNAATASRLAAFQTFLMEQGISSSEDLREEDSPQYHAAKWIADLDVLKVEIPPAALMDEAFLIQQRYILAVMYYALGGQEWEYTMGFLGGTSECDWNFGLDSGHRPKVDLEGDIDLGVTCDKFGQVNQIFIPGNGLTGELPTELGLLTGLAHLSLFNNSITGELPEELQYLTNLDFVAIESNLLSGNVPAWINQWTNLEALALGDNQFSGQLPSFTGLKFLTEVALDFNLLTGTIDVFNAVPTLESVFVNDNGFDGRIDAGTFLGFENLEILDLSDNFFTGYFPEHFFNCRIVDLHNNSLAGFLPEVALDSYPLEFLSLHDNDFQGPIPASLGFLEQLTHLDLSYNNFDGEVFDSINNLVNLEFLFLARNPLAPGRIPVLSDLQNLKELSLKGTDRTGVIPHWLGNMQKLVLLDLHDNALTGTIPPELGNSPRLAFMLLNKNNLSGGIPENLANLERLTMLFLDKNDLSEDAFDFCEEWGEELEFASADCDADEISCPCCGICCSDGDEGCNNAELIVSFENGYTRDQYVFSEDLVFRPDP